jgi:hypothetical protein
MSGAVAAQTAVGIDYLTTNNIGVHGPLSVSSIYRQPQSAVAALTATGTLSASALVGGVLQFAPASTAVFTFPTSTLLYAALVAQFGSFAVGAMIEAKFFSTSTAAYSFAAGAGITFKQTVVSGAGYLNSTAGTLKTNGSIFLSRTADVAGVPQFDAWFLVSTQ